MVIKEIELYNFRIYKGKHKIDLLPEDEKNILILSGKNGFGKTTLLMSLVWCLYGRQMTEVDDLYKKEVEDHGGYGRYISRSLNRLAAQEGETKFSVSLSFKDVEIPGINCNELKISRSFDTATGTNDNIEILVDGHVNEMTEEVGEEHFIRDFILPKEIAKFFFFDAEKIVNLAEINTTQQRKRLSEAYSEVLGIQKYVDLREELEGYQKTLKAETASKKEREELRQMQVEVENAQDTIEENKRKIEELNEEILQKRDDSKSLQEKLIRAGSIITLEELNELREKETELEEKLENIEAALKESYETIPFAIAGANLGAIAEQVERELENKKAKFEQERVESVIDNVIDDFQNEQPPDGIVFSHKARRFVEDTMDKLIKKHFFSDVKEVPDDYKVLHDYSEPEFNDIKALISHLKLSFKDKFKNIVGDYNQFRNELASVKRKISDAEGKKENPLIEEDRKKREALEEEIQKLTEEVGGLRRDIENLENDIIQKNKSIDNITRKLQVSESMKEKYEVTSRLIKELQEFIVKFKENKKKSLEKKIMKGIKSLMHKKGFIDAVKVEIIGENIDVLLLNEKGEEISKSSLSMGEKQLYATALLYGLVEESGFDFPLFIDSPMQKLDADHAKNIIEFFYPNIAEQVVIFPLIKKEMSKEEYDLLVPNIAHTYLIQNVAGGGSYLEKVKPEELFEKFEESEVAHAD